MPAAVLENTPQEAFGRNLANRKCSERRNVSRSLHRRSGTAKAKLKASARSGTESPERQCREAVTEPPGGRKRSQDPDQPPDGTGRRQGGRAMKAGSFGTTVTPILGACGQRCQQMLEARQTEWRSPKIDRAHAGDLGAGGNVGPICLWRCGLAHNIRVLDRQRLFSALVDQFLPVRNRQQFRHLVGARSAPSRVHWATNTPSFQLASPCYEYPPCQP